MTAHDRLRSSLLAVRRRWRIEAGLRALGRGALLVAAPLVAAVAVATWLAPGDGLQALLFAALAIFAAAVLVVTAWPFSRAPGMRQLARFAEERAAGLEGARLDDVLVTAVDATAGETTGFGELVVEDAVRRFDAIGPSRVVPPEALRRAAAMAAAGVVALALAIVVAWPMIGRASETAWITLFPQSIVVEVLPGDARVPAGRPLTIRASVRAGANVLTRFTPRLTVEAGGESRHVPMALDGATYQFAFESIDRTFTYRVTAGSRRSKDYTVTALVPPRVTRIDLRYDYPDFTKLAPRDESDAGDIYAPAGTTVRVRIHTDKPVASGRMAFTRASESDGIDPGALHQSGDRVLEGELVLAKDDSYRIQLTDRDGLSSDGDTEYFLRVMDDRPPDVRILRPAADQQITPLEEVAIEARADDDYGISRFELVYIVAGREAKVIPFGKAAGTELARSGTYTLAAEDLGVQPGDVITYYARARDVGRGKRSTEARSDMFFLEVRPFTEEYVLAQSQAMAGMASDQIEALITAQKEIINATWNIERRATSGAGRSTSDVTAIADAQTELRARAEQMASRTGRGRGVIRFPQQLVPGRQGAPPRGADPVGSAIAAMTRAIDNLEGQRTSEALPHEMAALQGLLQAQAEVRRREVAQQAGASMGGLGRQGQDLSALFDKELQRQQRTNYENRPQIDARADREEGESALDKIRDLAERQEELARRQRELARNGVSADEMKRQLETLTREQEELRQRAEELARQMGPSAGTPTGPSAGQQANQPQGQQGSTSSGSGSGTLREASEQMRGAAGELQRQSPSGAAERSERAAAGLRRLEQQMRRDDPEARQRAAGDLRLEAQQVADEQRRIAAEAARLEKGTESADRDGWRRLSGDKEKLADRVDALQRSAEQLSKSEASSRTGDPVSAAAQALSRQQIADRMREGARKMRDAAPADAGSGRGSKPAAPAGAAAAEQQMARTLEQIADGLGGGTPDAAELARQLDRTRTIRERLDRLERDMRDADARSGAGRQGRGSGAGNGGGEDAQRLREQYGKELQSARQSLAELERGSPGSGLGGASPEQHEWSPVDQGKEGFKQDFSTWESLRKDIDSALDRYDASVIARAARKSLQDRLSAGPSDRAPDDYRTLIARYYEALARKK